MVSDNTSPLDRELWITRFDDVAAIYRQSEMLSLRALTPRLLETTADIKDKLPLLKLASFGDRRTTRNSLRFDSNVREIWGIEGDYDAERLTPEDLADALRRHHLAGLVVTSPSHREDAPRARLLLPCSTPLKPADRARMVSRLAGIIPDDLAAESWTLSQAYYVGKVGDAPRHRAIEVEGDCIDLRDDLDATAKPKPPAGKRRAPAKTNGAAPVDQTDLLLDADLPLDVTAALDAIAAGDASHAALVRLAGRWAAFGLPRQDIVAALRDALLRRPEAERDAGWADAMRDLPRLVAWTAEQEAADEAPPSPAPQPVANGADEPEDEPPAEDETDLDSARAPLYSDDTLALVFAEQHAGRLRYVAAWSQWFAWNGYVWDQDDTLRVFSRLRLLLRQAAHSCRKKRVADALGSAKTVAAVERLTRVDRRLAATDRQWNHDLHLLNSAAGAVILGRSGIVTRPPRREDYCTKITTVAPADTANCPIWLGFLHRIMGGDPQMVGYLQRVCGYCLTGETVEHSLFFGHGTGANGKSTFANVLLGILGTGPSGYAAVAPITTFSAGTNEQHPTDLAMLHGVRCVIATETEDQRSWPIAKLKMMVSGDPITARFMHRDFFTYRPQFKVLICANHKPRLRSVDEAISRRLHLIPFNVTIPAAERDPQLGDRLRAEYPAILRWMLNGCAAWQQHGLQPPATVTGATAEYLAGEDLIQAWIDEECEVGRSNFDHASALYRSFKLWIEAAGERVPSQRWFAAALADRGFRPSRTMAARGYVGIALRSAANPTASDDVPP